MIEGASWRSRLAATTRAAALSMSRLYGAPPICQPPFRQGVRARCAQRRMGGLNAAARRRASWLLAAVSRAGQGARRHAQAPFAGISASADAAAPDAYETTPRQRELASGVVARRLAFSSVARRRRRAVDGDYARDDVRRMRAGRAHSRRHGMPPTMPMPRTMSAILDVRLVVVGCFSLTCL